MYSPALTLYYYCYSPYIVHNCETLFVFSFLALAEVWNHLWKQHVYIFTIQMVFYTQLPKASGYRKDRSIVLPPLLIELMLLLWWECWWCCICMRTGGTWEQGRHHRSERGLTRLRLCHPLLSPAWKWRSFGNCDAVGEKTLYFLMKKKIFFLVWYILFCFHAQRKNESIL